MPHSSSGRQAKERATVFNGRGSAVTHCPQQALHAPDNKRNTNEGLWDAAAATMGEELTPRVIKNIILSN